MSLPTVTALTALAVVLASCSKEQNEYTEKERQCIAQRFNDYNPKQLGQCVDVCAACLKGTVATCNTSCKMKGAS